MDWWMAYPWVETLYGIVFFLGLATATVLLIIKYPASRRLGRLLVSYLLLVIAIELEALFPAEYFFVAYIAFSLLSYVQSFFDQKSSAKIIFVLLLIVLGAMVLFLPPDFQWISNGGSKILTCFFLFVSMRVVRTEGTSRGVHWFGNPGGRVVWFRNFTLLNAIILGLLIGEPGWFTSIIIASCVLLLLLFLQYQLIKESAFLSPIPLGNKYQKSTLNPAIKSSIVARLERAMVEKFYLRDDASLSSLATELGASTHHLSQVLNESLKSSFQDLLAQYRIREACQILRDQEKQQLKIENVANLVGYNSKSAFNTAFKRRMQLTPSEYRDAKEVRSYREERLPERKTLLQLLTSFSLSHHFSLKLEKQMGSNFFKIFFRNLKRNKVFSSINLFGLTMGFVCSILIFLFIKDETSFDKSIPDHDRIFRISWSGENPQTRTPHPMALAMVNDWPEVEAAVSISPWYGPGLNREDVRVKNVEKDVQFEEPNFFFADSTFFEVFDLKFVEGDTLALSKPWTLVITKSMSEKYFGQESAIGKELELNDMPIAVSAVVEGMPKNSHFHFNAIIPYMTLKQINPDDDWMTWNDFGHFNYIKTRAGIDASVLERQIPEWVSQFLNWRQEDLERLANGDYFFDLQPISAIHLTSKLRWELEKNGNILYIYILGITLVFLLLIAGINYVNLTTAKSLERAKEIGVRKTLGAVSGNLSIQFYLESVIFCFVAMVIAFGGSLLLLEGFNSISGKGFEATDVLNVEFGLIGLGVSVVIGILAGLYPAISLSAFKPTEVLKGKLTTSSSGVRMRSLLVILQFSISTVLIAGSFIILRQLDYLREKELGFDQEAIISIPIPSSVELGGIDVQKMYRLRNQIESIPGVKGTSMVSNLPGSQFNQHQIYALKNPDDRVDASEMMVDFGVEKIFDFEIVAGRGYEKSYAGDTTGLNFILNETATGALNLTEPIGEKLVWIDNDESHEGTIIGVVKDFHYKSLHEDIQPLLLSLQPYAAGEVIIKLDGNQFEATLNEIRKTYALIDEELVFEYQFLDQRLAKLYDEERNTLTIFSVFAGVALMLACLGLLGMAIAMLNQRIKEVGMRKILGASSTQIMRMIMGQFARLIAVALLIGLPIAYLLMQNWINEFSYRAAFGFWPYIGASIVLLAVALISVSAAVMKIAFSNPIESLRYE